MNLSWNKYAKLFSVVILLVSLTGCGVFNKTTYSGNYGSYSSKKVLQNTAALNDSYIENFRLDGCTFKGNINNQSIRFSGSLEYHDKQFIKITLTHLFGIEVFRVYITHDYVYIINKLGREYYKLNYDEVAKLMGTKNAFNIVNFDRIAAFFKYNFHETFEFKKRNVHVEKANVYLKKKVFSYPIQLNLQETESTNFNIEEMFFGDFPKPDIKVDYEKFYGLNSYFYPLKMSLYMQSTDNPTFSIEARKIKEIDAVELDISFVDNYKQGDLRKFIKY